jgi:multidrug efflux system membrane fusion protein
MIMTNPDFRQKFLAPAIALALGAAIAVPLALSAHHARGAGPAGQAAPPTPVSVAVVLPRDAASWDEFSGRLEAVERVDVRSRVAGAVQAIHFREGALVKAGDPLVTIDPAPFAAEVDAAVARVAAAQSRLALTRKEQDRGTQLLGMSAGAISQSSVDQRISTNREAEANLRAAQADLQTARLNLSYTDIRAPVAGRVGKAEITVGNLIAAGPNAPVLTTLVSVDPIYAGFDADEQIVAKAVKSVGAEANMSAGLDHIPVEMVTAGGGDPIKGHLQMIGNQVDAQSGTVRMRAVFANADGSLIPGQFARLRLGQAKPEPVLAITERALGTDQDKRFVIVIDDANKAAYREVGLGAESGGLRIVKSGLKSGDRIVVEGLQRVRPGAVVNPTTVPMDGPTELTQR